MATFLQHFHNFRSTDTPVRKRILEITMSYESLILRALLHYTRSSREDDEKWERMKREKARDAAENSHKEGWVPGGTAEKGHFVDDGRRGRAKGKGKARASR